ncbi:DUF211 domain-containing protein [Halobacterium zhouii]|uniref:DUF211 domain-containing protein n=1 Tax=Halobacterium zhouii TaxID=2902624 RepID=UPI001E467642|nr:DUF211 domain-containing protein [Halobacterium zhouii]
MSTIKRLVLDIMKPNEIETGEFARRLAKTDGADGVNATLIESDKKVQNLKLTIEGDDVDADTVEGTIEDLGGTIHSVDEVACGDRLVEESPTHQD